MQLLLLRRLLPGAYLDLPCARHRECREHNRRRRGAPLIGKPTRLVRCLLCRPETFDQGLARVLADVDEDALETQQGDVESDAEGDSHGGPLNDATSHGTSIA